MIFKEEVSKEDVECVETLLMMSNSKPTREEYNKLQLCILRRNKSSTITTPSTVMESKSHIHDHSLRESPTRRSRNRHDLPPMSPPMEQRKSKKAKRSTDASSSKTREPTPGWLISLMRSKNGGDVEDNSKKIIDKELFQTDVDPHQSRLSIPVSQIVELEFLNHEEKRAIEEDANRVRKEGVDAILVDSHLREFPVNLRLRDMRGILLYNLVAGWNQVVTDCLLEENTNIRLWSFHADDTLYFALVPLYAN
ncbi:unnamed protein product [Arabidopsis thaliana]|uniref:B3 domain-containing protein n=1 Tax=Arabidopsis thaliana TaxID=3702 RepID=A0A5S9X123_ARATH|nr:unnamed protein product [Arabidopsis thaliana]